MIKDVAVIIPIYNRPQFLHRSLGSVLAQTHPPKEVIVVDDHSDEPLDDVMQQVRSQSPSTSVRLLRMESNRGVSAARNAGIRASTSPLIALLDSDDEWLPNKLFVQVEYINTHPQFRLVHSEEIWIRNGRRVNPRVYHQKSGGDIFAASLHRCLISPSTVMMRRELFDVYGYFDEALPVCEDYDLWLRVLAGEDVGFIEEPLIQKYGGHPDQLSTTVPAMDRYRIEAMLNLAERCNLSTVREQALFEVVEKKATILLQGAQKRNLPEAARYQSWLQKAQSKK